MPTAGQAVPAGDASTSERRLLLATPLMALLLFLPFGGWALAALAPLTLWPAFQRAVSEDRDFDAWRSAVLWAILLSIGVLAFAWFFPQLAGSNVVRGAAYREEMFAWIATGEGKEGSWRLFLPEHALHLALFSLLSLASGGYVGLALGAGLLAYMNYFVASVMAASGSPLSALTAAWFPWSVARVLAFIAIGVLLARPLLRRGHLIFTRRHRTWLLWAAGGIAADILLKVALAATFRVRLAALLEVGTRATS